MINWNDMRKKRVFLCWRLLSDLTTIVKWKLKVQRSRKSICAFLFDQIPNASMLLVALLVPMVVNEHLTLVGISVYMNRNSKDWSFKLLMVGCCKCNKFVLPKEALERRRGKWKGSESDAVDCFSFERFWHCKTATL